MDRLSLKFVVFLCGAVAFGQQLSAPVHRAAFPEALAGGRVPPKWAGSVLISRKPSTSHSDAANNLTVYDKSGRTVRSIRVWVPDAVEIWLRDVTGSVGDVVTVVGNAQMATGEFAGYLAYVSLKEGTAQIIQTTPFFGERVAMAPDGSAWILGYQLGEGRRITRAPEHAILRHYSKDGKLVGESLPWSEFRCGLHPALRSTQVAASKDRIGVLLPECHEWVELNPAGEMTGRWKWQDSPEYLGPGPLRPFWNVAMTASNQVYASIGLELFRLNRDQGVVWQAVGFDALISASAPYGYLVGSEGESLVYESGSELVWAKVSLSQAGN